MTSLSRHDRTVRLLSTRLETLAVVAERSPRAVRELEPSILRAAVATRNAVALDLLSREEAGAIWSEVADRHPGLGAGWPSEYGVPSQPAALSAARAPSRAPF